MERAQIETEPNRIRTDLCRKSNPTQRCINKEKSPKCSACKSTSQSTTTGDSTQGTTNTSASQNSNSSIDLDTTSTADLRRHLHYNDPDYTFERVVPKDSYDGVMKAIQNAYQIDIDEQTYFTDFELAKEYFYRTFLYINNDSVNLFKFHDPKKINDDNSDSDSSPESKGFKVTLKDVISLFDNNQLTSNVVDFVLECLNFYSINSSSEDTVPSFLFGNSKVMNKIVPHKQNYPRLWEHYNLILDDN